MSHQPPSLDELTALLASTRPAPDEEMNQRVAARLSKRLSGELSPWTTLGLPKANPLPPPPQKRASWRPFMIGGLAAAAALAVAVGVVIDSETIPTKEMTSQAATPASPPRAPPSVGATKPLLDLAQVRGDALIRLRNSIRHVEPKVRIVGVDTLAKLDDETSIPLLLRLTARDPDAEVRGHAAEALGKMRAASASEELAKLETEAPPPLKVWYASGLARLGVGNAIQRLRIYARHRDLAVSLKATLVLAELSSPGNKLALDALKTLTTREAELNETLPYAGALILTEMAALGDRPARMVLHGLLESSDEGARLAAAEGLARLGDDAGKAVLKKVASDPSSPNQMVAVAAQFLLGENASLELLLAQVLHGHVEMRRFAVRALGEFSAQKDLDDPKVLALLVRLSIDDQDALVRVAAAAALALSLERRAAMRSWARAEKDAMGTGDVFTRVETALAFGDLRAAEENLTSVVRQIRAHNQPFPIRADHLYARLYELKAEATKDIPVKRRILQLAHEHYRRVIELGDSKAMVHEAMQQLKQLEEALAQLPAP